MTKKLVIFDVDGTLYEQKGLRKIMMSAMLQYHLFRPFQWINIPIILSYRKLRENAADIDFGTVNMETIFYKKVAKKYWCSPKYVAQVVQQWMQEKPLPFLKDFRYKGIVELLKNLQSRGIKIAVYSDLPTFGKLEVMDLKFDLVVDSTMPPINCLKPNPKGLIYICNTLKINISDAVFIGDREDRDKACAERIQMDCLIVRNGDTFYLDLLEEVKSWQTTVGD